jgi:hypothetical protein
MFRAVAAKLAVVGVLTCSLLWSAVALTQESRDPDAALPVRERDRPGYDPAGIRLGSFLFYQSLTAAPFYDSNVFAAPRNEVGDSGILLAPHVWATSQFSRHAVEIDLGAELRRHRRERSEDRIDAFARVNGRLDIQQDLVALLILKAEAGHEDRGSVDSPARAAEPVPVRNLAASGTLNKTFNRFGLSLGAGAQWTDYEDVRRIGGGIVDQDFRDHLVYSIGGRATYAWLTGNRLFVDIRGNWRDYAGSGPVAFGSHGVNAVAGLEFALTTLLHGELGLGYLHQSYDSPLLPDVQGPSYLASLVWNATPLLTVTATGERQVRDSFVAGAAARIESTFQLVLDYELLRNLIISPQLRLTHEDYPAIARTDSVVEPGLKIDYLVNRYLALGGQYTFTTRESDISGAGFVRHQASIHATAQF